MIDEIEWDWPREYGKPFKIILNLQNGVLEVLNDQGETIIRKTHLSKKQIMFLYHRLKNRLPNQPSSTNPLRPDRSFDPMIT
ncbi:MAG: hypothetical protein KKC68_02505 [Candidatus Thermoplasmatota archaeon]|nr:hypothetical protein [Candidatus Thermoplasmatota archaeon]MBU1940623.1 hypothetical protein [Candidatus Thermoplasmatota archaeon]